MNEESRDAVVLRLWPLPIPVVERNYNVVLRNSFQVSRAWVPATFPCYSWSIWRNPAKLLTNEARLQRNRRYESHVWSYAQLAPHGAAQDVDLPEFAMSLKRETKCTKTGRRSISHHGSLLNQPQSSRASRSSTTPIATDQLSLAVNGLDTSTAHPPRGHTMREGTNVATLKVKHAIRAVALSLAHLSLTLAIAVLKPLLTIRRGGAKCARLPRHAAPTGNANTPTLGIPFALNAIAPPARSAPPPRGIPPNTLPSPTPQALLTIAIRHTSASQPIQTGASHIATAMLTMTVPHTNTTIRQGSNTRQNNGGMRKSGIAR